MESEARVGGGWAGKTRKDSQNVGSGSWGGGIAPFIFFCYRVWMLPVWRARCSKERTPGVMHGCGLAATERGGVSIDGTDDCASNLARPCNYS